MSALHPGSLLGADQSKGLGLVGRWCVWSMAADAPGAYFLAPSDTDARATGLKYVVVKAQMGRSSVEPRLSLLRTDPHRPDLLNTNRKDTRR